MATRKWPALLLVLLAAGLLPAKFHPQLKWCELAQGKVIVIFPRGYEREAGHTLKTALRLHESLRGFWQSDVRGPIHILLDDSGDEANGFATFFPFNLIGVNLFDAEPDSTIGSSQNWIDFVLTHEMCHIFTMNAATDMVRRFRRVFGTLPVLYPVMALPLWVLEGLAVYGESALDAGGRLNTPDFAAMISAAAPGGVPSWRRLSFSPTRWPGASAHYLYGGEFFGFLAEQYGRQKINEYVLLQSANFLTFSAAHGFRSVFGKGLDDLWREFSQQWVAGVSPEVTFLTKDGCYKDFPQFLDQDRVLFARSDFRRFPAIEIRDLASGRTRTLLKLAQINGLHLSRGENTLYISAAESFHAFYNYSDIYSLDLASGRLRRLSRGKRLLYPLKDPAGDGLFCVQRRRGRSRLVYFNPRGPQGADPLDPPRSADNGCGPQGTDPLDPPRSADNGCGPQGTDPLDPPRSADNGIWALSAEFAALAYPAISADGQQVAVSLKAAGHNWQIGIFDRQGQLRETIGDGQAKVYYPVWGNDGWLYFLTHYQGGYRLARWDPDAKRAEVLAAPEIPSLRHFTFSADGSRLIVSLFSGKGFDLAELKSDQCRFTPLSFSAAAGAEPEAENPAGSQVRPYWAGRDLRPHFWSLSYRAAGDDFQAGILTSGQDVPARHSYSLEGYYGFLTRSFNLFFSYTYDGLFPSLSLTLRHSTDLFHDSLDREYQRRLDRLGLNLFWPLLKKNRFTLNLLADFHLEQSGVRFQDENTWATETLNGFRVGLLYDSSQRYYDSISPSDGTRFSLSWSDELQALGSDKSTQTALLEIRRYQPLFRPGVLALRLVQTVSWGEQLRHFRLGGNSAMADYHLAGDDPFGLLRGFPAGFFQGSAGYLFNLEFRLPLFRIERNFLKFFNLERAQVNLFCDVGRVGTWKEPAWSLGMETGLIAYFIGLRLDLAAGLAWGLNPANGPRFYVRFGESF